MRVLGFGAGIYPIFNVSPIFILIKKQTSIKVLETKTFTLLDTLNLFWNLVRSADFWIAFECLLASMLTICEKVVDKKPKPSSGTNLRGPNEKKTGLNIEGGYNLDGRGNISTSSASGQPPPHSEVENALWRERWPVDSILSLSLSLYRTMLIFQSSTSQSDRSPSSNGYCWWAIAWRFGVTQIPHSDGSHGSEKWSCEWCRFIQIT